MRLPIATCFVGFLKIKWVKVPRLPIAACFVGFLKIYRVKVPRKDPKVKTKRPGAAGQQKLEMKADELLNCEHNLISPEAATGAEGCSVVPSKRVAGLSRNADDAMQASVVRAREALRVQAAGGEQH